MRCVIKQLCNVRKAEISQPNLAVATANKMSYIESLSSRDIAIKTDEANKQHYEVSTEFLASCLGKRMKYSSCLYETPETTLDEAEVAMLETYCQKAKLEDGMSILDLGCGWGSVAIFLAKVCGYPCLIYFLSLREPETCHLPPQKYPNAHISALSNSKTQKIYIDSKGLKNLTVYTGDVRVFEFPKDVR